MATRWFERANYREGSTSLPMVCLQTPVLRAHRPLESANAHTPPRIFLTTSHRNRGRTAKQVFARIAVCCRSGRTYLVQQLLYETRHRMRYIEGASQQVAHQSSQ